MPEWQSRCRAPPRRFEHSSQKRAASCRNGRKAVGGHRSVLTACAAAVERQTLSDCCRISRRRGTICEPDRDYVHHRTMLGRNRRAQQRDAPLDHDDASSSFCPRKEARAEATRYGLCTRRLPSLLLFPSATSFDTIALVSSAPRGMGRDCMR
jgi:hypothetical protein